MITGFATSLAIPDGTVKNTAAVLRAAGLLTSGPRGPGAPHMTPTDATNLLLGLMYDDTQDAAAVNVPRLRAAVLTSYRGVVGVDYGGGDAPHIPPHHFVGEGGRSFDLGEVLDRVFDTLVRHGSLDAEPEDDATITTLPYVKNFDFSVSRPGHSVRIWIDSVAVHWTLAFTWRDPEVEARRASAAARGELVQHRLAHLGTYMHRTRSIGDNEFFALADVLRGCKVDPDDPHLDFAPPYGR